MTGLGALLVRTGAIRRRTRISASGAILASLAALLTATPGFAQEAQPPKPAPPPPEATPGQEIVITGSRIPRPNLTAISPVTVVDAKEVKLQGTVLTEQLINGLPQVTPDQGLNVSNGASGTSTVNLRDFGPSRTLVLVNGRRLLPGDASYVAADVNFIPSALIQRVEVLTGGASSVYGSDAIAGVVNFILDTKLDGVRIDGQSSFYQHDNRNREMRQLLQDADYSFPTGNTVDGSIQDINAVYGRGFAGGRGHVTVYAGFRQAEGLAENARDFSACAITVNTPEDSPFCGGTPTSALGTFTIPRFFIQYHVAADRQFAPGPSLFNFAPYNFYQRPDRRYTGGGFASFAFSSAVNLYAEAMYMDDRTTAQIAPSGNFGATRTINCDNPLLSPQEVSLICFDGNFVGQRPIFDDDGNLLFIRGTPTVFTDPTTGTQYRMGQVRVQRRNVEGGPRQEILTHRDLRLLGGFKGALGRGVSYDASYLYSRVRQAQFHTNDLLISRLVNSLDVVTDPASGQPVCRAKLSGADPACVPWDIFSLNTVTPQAIAYLSVPSSLKGEVREQVANASLTVDLGEWGLRSPWAEEAPGLNVGAEYRKDRLSLEPDEHFANADLSGLATPITPLEGATSVKELFGEVRVPLLRSRLVDELTIEAGYRHSWHRNATNSVQSSSYKIGADLSPIRGIRFRASQQRAVRAPDVQELFAQTFVEGFESDPCAGFSPQASQEQCAATGVTAAEYGQIERQTDASQGYNAIGGGNAALTPEIATTRTVGVVIRPAALRRFSFTADWFDIRLKGAIGTIGAQQIMDSCIATGDPLFCSRIHRDSEGSLFLTPEGLIDDTNANFAALKTSGIDFASTYSQPLGKLGSLNLEFQGTWTRQFIIDLGGNTTPFDCAGLYGIICGPPQPSWRHNARVTWETPKGLSLSLLWRHWASVPADEALARQLAEFEYNPISKRIPAREYFDVTAIARFGARYQLRVGVRNVFDKQPPLIAAGMNGPCGGFGCNGNTFTQFYDPLGRFIFFGATVNFKP